MFSQKFTEFSHLEKGSTISTPNAQYPTPRNNKKKAEKDIQLKNKKE